MELGGSDGGARNEDVCYHMLEPHCNPCVGVCRREPHRHRRAAQRSTRRSSRTMTNAMEVDREVKALPVKNVADGNGAG